VATACCVAASVLPATTAFTQARAARRRRLSTESWIGWRLPRSSALRFCNAIE
jgi:hypothetical protein